jgi:hypothetical protein
MHLLRNKQIYNSRCQVMALQTTVVARQWLSNNHVGSPRDTNTTVALLQRKGVFCAIRAVQQLLKAVIGREDIRSLSSSDL